MAAPVSTQRVFVAGHGGMVGSALLRRLAREPGVELVTRDRAGLDLTRQAEVEQFFQDVRVDRVYVAAARVGGILANSRFPAEFIYENLAMECNLVHAAHRAGVPSLLFLGSSCIYPRLAPQPMREESLLTGELEPTNAPYAVAKIAGMMLCASYRRQYGRDYRSVMPTNLYGPFDNFHPDHSHVVPGLLRRFHEAARAGADEVVVWGSGRPRREFMHVDDMADACVHLMGLDAAAWDAATSPAFPHVNIGTGADCTIRELSGQVARITGFGGRLVFDDTRPDGAPRKLLDVSRLHGLGWHARIGLDEGLRDAYAWFLDHASAYRGR